MAFAFENTLLAPYGVLSSEIVSDRTCVFTSFLGEDSSLVLLTTDTTQYTTDNTIITTDQTTSQE